MNGQHREGNLDLTIGVPDFSGRQIEHIGKENSNFSSSKSACTSFNVEVVYGKSIPATISGREVDGSRKNGHSEKPMPLEEDLGPKCCPEANSARVPPAIRTDPPLASWDGNRDHEHPKNFSRVVKLLISFIIGMMNFIVSLAISIFSGVLEAAAMDLGYSKSSLELGVSIFILGLAIGPAFFGPASECYGRKWPLVCGMIGFLVFTCLVTLPKNLVAILVCRFLSGLCGSSAYVIPPGMFVDPYGPVARVIGYSIFASGAFVGGSLGPGVGTLITAGDGINWRWSMWLTSLVATPLITVLLFLPECFEPVILQRKSQSLKRQAGSQSLHCPQDDRPLQLHKFLVRPWQMLCQEPVLAVVTMAFTLDYGIQSLTYSVVPVAFQILDSWTPSRSAWALAITIPGFALGCIVVVMDTKIRFQKQLTRRGAIVPEKRLPPMIVGMTLLSFGLLCFGWNRSWLFSWHWRAFSEILIGFGMYMVWVTVTVYVQDLYGKSANSALAACAFVRYSVGATFPMFAQTLYERLGVPWTVALLGILCVVLTPLHILFYFFGGTVRRWSKFALLSRVGFEEELQ